MRELPHLSYLHAFEAAARLLSFTRAGEELNCTQAAISQRIRALEQYFGRPLFHRKANGLELSLAGAAYLPGIAQALDMMDAATRGLTGKRAERVVTVSAPISFFNRCLIPLLPEFEASHPEIALRLNSSIWTDPNIDLADLSIGVGEAQFLPSDAIRLADAPLQRVALMGEGAPAARRIEVQGKFLLWELWSEAAAESFEAELPPCRVDTADTALHLAAEGFGHTVVYAFYARALGTAGRVSGSEPVNIGHILMLQLNPARRPQSAVHAFVDWLTARVAQGMI